MNIHICKSAKKTAKRNLLCLNVRLGSKRLHSRRWWPRHVKCENLIATAYEMLNAKTFNQTGQKLANEIKHPVHGKLRILLAPPPFITPDFQSNSRGVRRSFGFISPVWLSKVRQLLSAQSDSKSRQKNSTHFLEQRRTTLLAFRCGHGIFMIGAILLTPF